MRHAVLERPLPEGVGVVPGGRQGAEVGRVRAVLGAVGTVSPLALLTVIGLLSTFFTLVISNVGATVLLVPLVVNMAQAAGADPRMAALVVGLGTSNSFILPTHQVNALIMRPGGYRTKDYMRAGLGMTALYTGVLMLCVNFLFTL